MPGKQHLTRTWRSHEVPGHFGGESLGKIVRFCFSQCQKFGKTWPKPSWQSAREFQKITS